MAKPTEQSGESFMLKLARFIVDKRNLVFLVVIIALIIPSPLLFYPSLTM